MRVTVLTSDPTHHCVPAMQAWCARREATLAFSKLECDGGDLLLLVSCTEIIGRDLRSRYAKALDIHESDVPQGRGWSPLAWQILEGRHDFTVTLMEAGDKVDTGAVWRKEKLHLWGHELSDEINAARDAVRERLMDWAIENFATVKPQPQAGVETYYARRTPADSRLNPVRSIAEQFDLLRICEPRFPAFFELRGHRYEISLRKVA